MAVKYLAASHAPPFAEIRITDQPRYGMCRDGYTCRRGAPTCYLVRLWDESKAAAKGPWRRVMIWQFSNAGTLFVRVRGENHLLDIEHQWALRDAK